MQLFKVIKENHKMKACIHCMDALLIPDFFELSCIDTKIITDSKKCGKYGY